MIAAVLLVAALAAAPAAPGDTAALADEPPGAEPPAGGAGPATTAIPSGAGAPYHTFDTPPGPLQLRVAGIPIVSYGSNVGVQVGAALLFYRTPKDGGPRRDWLALAASWTSQGPRSVEAKGERYDLFGSRVRALYQARYVSDSLAPYWGEGAHLAPGDTPGAGSPPEPYRYHGVGPWLSLILRHPLELAGPGWWAGGRVRFRQLDVYFPGAALAAARPPGASGGTLTAVYAGVLRDTRDDETSPTRGTLADASIFGSPPAVSDHAMWGANVGLRGYRALARGVVLAARALYDLKLGDVPFYERTQVEGLNYAEGLGGPGTLRGVARARIAGEEKVLLNVELRATLLTFRPGGRSLDLGVSAGADAGRGRQRGHSPVYAMGGFGGLRVIWDRVLVVRFDVGHAGQGGPGYYVAFEESF